MVDEYMLDVNILLDYVLRRETVADRLQKIDRLFDLIESGLIIPYVTVTSLVLAEYIITKQSSRDLAFIFLKGFIPFCKIVECPPASIQRIVNIKQKDFEDEVLLAAADTTGVNIITGDKEILKRKNNHNKVLSIDDVISINS